MKVDSICKSYGATLNLHSEASCCPVRLNGWRADTDGPKSWQRWSGAASTAGLKWTLGGVANVLGLLQ